MGYSFRTANGTLVPFKCNLEDKVRAITDDGETIEGIVEGLDDDGYVFISHDGEETRVYNDDIILNRKRVWARMSGYLEGTEEQIAKLMSLSNGEVSDIDFDSNDIKDLTFVSENEGYIPWCIVEEYFN